MSTHLICERCEFEEYVNFLQFPVVSKKEWIRIFNHKEERIVCFCSIKCLDIYKRSYSYSLDRWLD